MNANNELNVVVTGSDEKAKHVVTNVIHDALRDSGFNNVNIVDKSGSDVAATGKTTVLDLARQQFPDIFEQPVRVWTSAPAEQDELSDEQMAEIADKAEANASAE